MLHRHHSFHCLPFKDDIDSLAFLKDIGRDNLIHRPYLRRYVCGYGRLRNIGAGVTFERPIDADSVWMLGKHPVHIGRVCVGSVILCLIAVDDCGQDELLLTGERAIATMIMGEPVVLGDVGAICSRPAAMVVGDRGLESDPRHVEIVGRVSARGVLSLATFRLPIFFVACLALI